MTGPLQCTVHIAVWHNHAATPTATLARRGLPPQLKILLSDWEVGFGLMAEQPSGQPSAIRNPSLEGPSARESYTAEFSRLSVSVRSKLQQTSGTTAFRTPVSERWCLSWVNVAAGGNRRTVTRARVMDVRCVTSRRKVGLCDDHALIHASRCACEDAYA